MDRCKCTFFYPSANCCHTLVSCDTTVSGTKMSPDALQANKGNSSSQCFYSDLENGDCFHTVTQKRLSVTQKTGTAFTQWLRKDSTWLRKRGCPRAVNKRAVTYHNWCGSSESGPRGSPFSIPSYLYKDLDKHVLRNFSRFRLRAHHLWVESCKWHGGSSICDKCECGEVQNEKHVLFFCKCAEVCELRMRYRDLF